MIEEEKKSLAIMQQCPRFEKCSVPSCPLALLQEVRDSFPDEAKCTLAKVIRYRIGKDTELPRKGLTNREWAGKMKWDSLSDAEKHMKLDELAGFRAKSPLCQSQVKK